ncbi:MAG: hypothetical protein Q4G61_00675, partial [Tissierellia bacterium]|nr:hypothetical protein [Tissierellia bacterium]
YSYLKLGKWWNVSVTIIYPILAIFMLLWQLIPLYQNDPEWYNPFGVYTIGTLILQILLICVLAFVFNDKISDAVGLPVTNQDYTK